MKNAHLKFTNEGWVVEVPRLLLIPELTTLVRYAVKQQTDRWRCLPPGDKKTTLGLAIEMLKKGQVNQQVMPNRYGEHVLMEAKR